MAQSDEVDYGSGWLKNLYVSCFLFPCNEQEQFCVQLEAANASATLSLVLHSSGKKNIWIKLQFCWVILLSVLGVFAFEDDILGDATWIPIRTNRVVGKPSRLGTTFRVRDCSIPASGCWRPLSGRAFGAKSCCWRVVERVQRLIVVTRRAAFVQELNQSWSQLTKGMLYLAIHVSSFLCSGPPGCKFEQCLSEDFRRILK